VKASVLHNAFHACTAQISLEERLSTLLASKAREICLVNAILSHPAEPFGMMLDGMHLKQLSVARGILQMCAQQVVTNNIVTFVACMAYAEVQSCCVCSSLCLSLSIGAVNFHVMSALAHEERMM